jgi:hypothetical protein
VWRHHVPHAIGHGVWRVEATAVSVVVLVMITVAAEV